jgi:BASS family bile acid:Na+ symporter
MLAGIDIRMFADAFMFLWLFVLMFQMGISVSLKDMLISAGNHVLLIKSLTANFIIVPFAALALLVIFKPTPGISVGFLTLIVFAGAPFGPPVAGIAKGDMPFSIGLMLILTLISTAIAPFLLVFLAGFLPGTGVFNISRTEILKVVITGQIIPIAIGLGLRHFTLKTATRILIPVKRLSGVLTAGSFAVVLFIDHKMLFIFELKAFSGMLLLFIISICSGYFLGGTGIQVKRSLAILTTIRNAAAALVIINASFPGSPAFASALTYSVLSVLGSLVFAFVAGRQQI